MPKNYILACLCSLILCPVVTFAQDHHIERGKPFEEPESGASRLIMLKNGNTLFLNFSRKEGINVTVYDQKHRAKPIVHVLGKEWDPKEMDNSSLKGLYEINGNAVVFLEQVDRRVPLLFRLIINGKNGKLLKEEKIAELPKITVGAGYGMLFNMLSLPDFYVRKDPQSDYYAVAVFNSLSHERDKRIEVIHYAPDHKEINRAFYESPEGTYKYLRFLDMYVNRDEFVFITNYAYNTRSSGGKDSRVLISRLLKNAKTFDYKFLDYTDDYKDVDVATRYDSIDKKLYILNSVAAKSVDKEVTSIIMGRGTNYVPANFGAGTDNLVLQMNIVDPFALAVTNKYFIDHPLLSAYAKEHLKYKKPYYGAIQDFRINPDQTISLMFEELKLIRSTSYHSILPANTPGTTVNPSMGGFGTVADKSITTRLGDIGIVRINPDGKEVAGYALAKSQEAETMLDQFHVNRRPMSNWTYRKRNFWSNNMSDISGFFSYDYFNVDHKEMVIYNDYARNIEEDNENYRGKKKMRYISDSHTVCAVYDGTTIKKTYLFGESGDDDNNCFCSMEMNTHSEDGKSFATMMIEKKNGDKKAYIVWVTL